MQGDYASIANRRTNFPRLFTGYLDFLAVFKKKIFFYSTSSRETPNDALRNPSCETMAQETVTYNVCRNGHLRTSDEAPNHGPILRIIKDTHLP